MMFFRQAAGTIVLQWREEDEGITVTVDHQD